MQDREIRRVLHQLGRALVRAVSSSDDATEAVRRIRQRGYSLYLVLDFKDEDRGRPQIELRARPQGAEAKPARPAPDPDAEASFRLTGHDVAFLKSLGIDATRPARRRRSS